MAEWVRRVRAARDALAVHTPVQPAAASSDGAIRTEPLSRRVNGTNDLGLVDFHYPDGQVLKEDLE